MLEILYTSLVVFGVFFGFYICSPVFKPLKLFMCGAQLILCFILFSKKYYKKHSLWKEPVYNNIHEVPYYPIQSIDLNNSGDIDIKESNDTIFSIIKTEEYSNECLQNFFIKHNVTCPITNIIIENSINEKYENYTRLKIDDDIYIYIILIMINMENYIKNLMNI